MPVASFYCCVLQPPPVKDAATSLRYTSSVYLFPCITSMSCCLPFLTLSFYWVFFCWSLSASPVHFFFLWSHSLLLTTALEHHCGHVDFVSSLLGTSSASCTQCVSAPGRSLLLCLLFTVTLFFHLTFVPWCSECSHLPIYIVHELCCSTAAFKSLYCCLLFLCCWSVFEGGFLIFCAAV